ncbi:hypothetical protein ILUMI_10273 [Ignelater luminosus]|uniref:DUF4371 domain-containing protein n=1 Tax=Ignelater luminosus TaxID=2038154 RepID=A0A8K0D2D9_IGNLU|nr:hypothetical protein ILUMI_10273 [Ignelater luminosus]
MPGEECIDESSTISQQQPSQKIEIDTHKVIINQIWQSLRIEHVLSEAARLAALKHYEEVRIRKVLGRLIQADVSLLKQELPFREHQEDNSSINRDNYLQLLHYTAQEEQFISDHRTSSSTFKGTSSDIQNELIETVERVLDKHIENELEEGLFVFVQADKTLDVSCKSQMSLIVRYCVKDRVKERFIGFYDVSKDKTAKGLSNVIINVLTEWNVINKIVRHTTVQLYG